MIIRNKHLKLQDGFGTQLVGNLWSLILGQIYAPLPSVGSWTFCYAAGRCYQSPPYIRELAVYGVSSDDESVTRTGYFALSIPPVVFV